MRYVNRCPDDQMHESVTYRCTACGKPFHKETDQHGFALCTGQVLEDFGPGGTVYMRDSRHAPAELRPVIR